MVLILPMTEYLGTYITDDGNYMSEKKLHIENKRKHILKYASFVSRNSDLPACCIYSSILYGCESWLCSSYGKMDTLYMSVLKTLLGVMKTTCSDICLIESGFMSLLDAVNWRRPKYFQGKCLNLPNTSLLALHCSS